MKLMRCRPIGLLLLTLHMAACASWEPAAVSPQLIQYEEPDQVRLTVANGDRVLVRNPEVRGDSIVGRAAHAYQTDTIVAVAVSEVRHLEVRRFDWGKTGALLVIGLSIVPALVVGVGYSIDVRKPLEGR
jgi:hypothetical protein